MKQIALTYPAAVEAVMCELDAFQYDPRGYVPGWDTIITRVCDALKQHYHGPTLCLPIYGDKGQDNPGAVCAAARNLALDAAEPTRLTPLDKMVLRALSDLMVVHADWTAGRPAREADYDQARKKIWAVVEAVQVIDEKALLAALQSRKDNLPPEPYPTYSLVNQFDMYDLYGEVCGYIDECAKLLGQVPPAAVHVTPKLRDRHKGVVGWMAGPGGWVRDENPLGIRLPSWVRVDTDETGTTLILRDYYAGN